MGSFISEGTVSTFSSGPGRSNLSLPRLYGSFSHFPFSFLGFEEVYFIAKGFSALFSGGFRTVLPPCCWAYFYPREIDMCGRCIYLFLYRPLLSLHQSAPLSTPRLHKDFRRFFPYPNLFHLPGMLHFRSVFPFRLPYRLKGFFQVLIGIIRDFIPFFPMEPFMYSLCSLSDFILSWDSGMNWLACVTNYSCLEGAFFKVLFACYFLVFLPL